MLYVYTYKSSSELKYPFPKIISANPNPWYHGHFVPQCSLYIPQDSEFSHPLSSAPLELFCLHSFFACEFFLLTLGFLLSPPRVWASFIKDSQSVPGLCWWGSLFHAFSDRSPLSRDSKESKFPKSLWRCSLVEGKFEEAWKELW